MVAAGGGTSSRLRGTGIEALRPVGYLWKIRPVGYLRKSGLRPGATC